MSFSSDDILDICESAVNSALRVGADEVEAYLVYIDEVETSLERNDVKLGKSHRKVGLGVRVFTDRSLGFSSVNELSKEMVERAVESAVKISKNSPRDPANTLPQGSPISLLNGIYDKAAEDFSPEDSLNKALEMLNTALDFDSRITVDSGAFNTILSEHAVVNSDGVTCKERISLFTWAIMGMAIDGDEVSNFDFQFDGTHSVKNIRVIDTAKKFAENVIRSLGSKKCESFRGSAVLTPDVVQQLLAEPISFAVSSKNVQKGMSRFSDKVGEKIASSDLTVIDDGTFPDGLASSSFDREGVAHRPLVLIDKGILKSFIYNTYTANREDCRSTGHASGDSRSSPTVGPTNILFKEGVKSKDDFLKEVEHGIIVTRFSGNVSPISGDFSGVVKGGFLVKGGEIVNPIRDTLVSGNTFQLLKNISAVSKERKKVYTTILPYIRVEDISITGG